MHEGDFLFELALAESAVIPEAIVVSRIDFGPEKVRLHCVKPGSQPISCLFDAAASTIAQQFSASWGVTINENVFIEEAFAPTEVNLPIRWREIHRDLSLTVLLRNVGGGARLTSIKLDAEAAQAVVVGIFRGQEVTVRLPLLDDSYSMWEAMYTFIETAELAVGAD